ncbi:MAG: quinolinate synthase NadA [Candidatus Cloacimonetes bacterium]|nr:quinolinate synthase NadA [Candidatus Cloacimonadota bacterium]
MLTATETLDARLIEKARNLKKQKNCLVLAHNYQTLAVQSIADYVGDSLEMALKATETRHDIILLCGIRIMAETAKLLNPEKKVLLSHAGAGCPLSEMKKLTDLKILQNRHPEAEVVCYVNATIDLRAASTVTCTSGNICRIIAALDKEREIICIPDRNLGNWAAYKTGRDLIMWDGYCSVHDQISAAEVKKVREKFPGHLLAVHPECSLEVCQLADYVCSTSQMIEYAKEHQKVIIGTEIGLYRQLACHYPEKELIPLSTRMSCADMSKTDLEAAVDTLAGELNEVNIPPLQQEKALRSLERMFLLLEK